MKATEMLASARIELQDLDEGAYFISDDSITRGMIKSVSLLSRFIPKKSVVEYKVIREITGETLTIASSTGTLAYKPLQDATISITGETEDTDYRVNNLTGVVTEIGALLPDGDYTVSYNLDPSKLDITELGLSESSIIRIDSVELQTSANSVEKLTFDQTGNILTFRGGKSLSEGDIVRITYFEPWTAPSTTDGNYPEHLDDVILIGTIGQALISKAEKLVQEAYTSITSGGTTLDDIAAVTFQTAPDVASKLTDSLTQLTAAEARFAFAVTKAALEDGLITATTGLIPIAIAKMSARTAQGATYLVTGETKFNTWTKGDRVGENYVAAANAEANLAQSYGVESNTNLELVKAFIDRTQTETNIGIGYVQSAAQRLAEVSRELEKYQLQVQQESQKISYYAAQLDKSAKYEVNSKQLLDIAGRLLASGQAKVNEFLVSLGIKPEYVYQRASSEQR